MVINIIVDDISDYLIIFLCTSYFVTINTISIIMLLLLLLLVIILLLVDNFLSLNIAVLHLAIFI
jgi:hypothetical protein